MIEDVVIQPMSECFVLWRCLHGGPLSRESINEWPSQAELPWARYRERNTPLLTKLTRIYGACAMIARDGDQIVGQLRFFPPAVWEMAGAGGLCLQQDYPAGPADVFAERGFPQRQVLQDQSLKIHCLMTGSPSQGQNPYQRRGIGTRLVQALIEWARTNGWESVIVDAFEDVPIIYEMTGSAGRSFWEKLGFRMVHRYPHPDLQQRDPFVVTLEEQAKAIGIPGEKARDCLFMRLDLI
jgi:GNAT superfamily N-acetyltransferase